MHRSINIFIQYGLSSSKEKEGLIKRVRDLELWRLMMQKRITISNKEETIAWISILCFYMLISGVCGGDRLLQMLLFWMENLKCLVFIMSESHTTYGRERWVSNKERRISNGQSHQVDDILWFCMPE
eukprot:1026865_1